MKQEKQEESILQWASYVLMEPVSNLKAIQDVKFVKNMLWRIDDLYFHHWEDGEGQESYTQVLEKMGQYFKEEIGTDITQNLQSLNVYKNVREVWQLLLCIAIKGNNRNTNISLIFQMDHSMQAELMKIVTEIIDKFGQNTAVIDPDQPEDEQTGTNERQMMIQLAQENEVLREECHRLENQLIREKQERTNATTLRKELEYNLEMMRLEKFTFFEVMANANRSSSKIFEDGDSGVLQSQSNLSQLAQDIVQFIRQQRKKIELETEKNSLLEDEVRELRENIRRCVEENEIYLNKLGDLTTYEREIQALREEINQKFDQNLYLQEQISTLQEEKANLINNLQRKAVEEHNSYKKESSQMAHGEDSYEPNNERRHEQRLKRKQTIKNQQAKASFNSSEGGDKSAANYSEYASQKQDITKRQMDDQLRQPELRNKLQREVIFLKKTISSLNKQIQTLKRTNQALQRSAKSFMDSNQRVVVKWEEDYEVLIDKMAALTKVNEDLKEENAHQSTQKEQIAKRLKVKEEEEHAKLQQKRKDDDNSIDSRSDSEISSNQHIQIRINGPPNTVQPQQDNKQNANQQAISNSKRDKVALWDQIVKKLRQIIREGKSKELSYENTIQSMRNENLKLLQLLRNKNSKINEVNESEIVLVKPYNGLEDSYFRNLQRVQSQEMRDSKLRLNHPRLSYIQIQEGEQLEQSMVSRLARQKSHYYNVNSKIVNDFDEKKPQASFINNQDYYNNLNKKLNNSIRESFEGLHIRINDHDGSGSIQLQKKMEEEISHITKQYQQLNSNYQNVFNKLHIYTQKLKQKESVKVGYENVLQQISKAQSEVKASHEAEIVKLRIVNQALNYKITSNIIEKEQFVECIGKLSASITAMKANQEKKQQIAFKQIQRVLLQASNRYNSSLKDPLAFLQSCLEVSKQEGQLQKFYRLYIKQKEKTKQLNEEIDLLSSVLLEYRNMIVS